jgi:hypothetical protein
MAFMFKGPASLTSGSVVDAASVTADNATVDIDLMVGDDLTVTDVLTTKKLIISNSGSLTINGGAEITSVEGTGTALTTKSYVDTAVSDMHKVYILLDAPGGVYTNVDLSTHHVYYFANNTYTNSTPTILTCTVLTSPAPTNGHRVLIAFIRRGNGAQVTLKLDFGSSIVEGTGNADAMRYINITSLFSSVLLYYVSAEYGGPRWLAHESNETTFSNS